MNFLSRFGTQKSKTVDGEQQYYITYDDGERLYEMKVDKTYYQNFKSFKSINKKADNFISRHVEHIELSEELLYKKSFEESQSIEEIVHNNLLMEDLRKAVQELPEQQRTRFISYYIYDMTYEQIAKRDGCTKMAVKFSVDRAKEKIIGKLKN